MSNHSQWREKKQRKALALLGAGLLVVLVGAALELWAGGLGFDPRIITGVGIFFLGLGGAQYFNNRVTRGDEVSVARKIAEEKDERLVMIRNRAGNRAFWVSLVLGYAGLLWSSFASNGQLPALEGDVLWFFLAGLVTIPFGVYLISYVYGVNQQ